MKKVDYYAVQGPWKMPKWLGFTLGGIFAVIFLGSAGLIVHLVRPPAAAVAATPAPDPKPAAPVAAVAAPAQPSAPVAAAAAPAADDAAPAQAAAPAKSHKHGKHRAAAKPAKSAVAKRGVSDAKAHQILAKHDSKSSRKSKDDLDRLLGL